MNPCGGQVPADGTRGPNNYLVQFSTFRPGTAERSESVVTTMQSENV
jgi:hypothetical protein